VAVARTWLQVRVDLVEGLGERRTPSPGRVFIVGPSHTFSGLGEAINQAFARWDLLPRDAREGRPAPGMGAGPRCPSSRW
jgi:hypothetical protein